MALDARPHGPAGAGEVVESGFPGEASLVRHHGRNTSRRDHFTRAGELDPGWTATAPGGPLRPDAETTTDEPANQGLDHASPLCGEQAHLFVRGSPDLPNGVALVPATASDQEPEMDQDEIFPTRRSSPLGLHRRPDGSERPRLADPVDDR